MHFLGARVPRVQNKKGVLQQTGACVAAKIVTAAPQCKGVLTRAVLGKARRMGRGGGNTQGGIHMSSGSALSSPPSLDKNMVDHRHKHKGYRGDTHSRHTTAVWQHRQEDAYESDGWGVWGGTCHDPYAEPGNALDCCCWGCCFDALAAARAPPTMAEVARASSSGCALMYAVASSAPDV